MLLHHDGKREAMCRRFCARCLGIAAADDEYLEIGLLLVQLLQARRELVTLVSDRPGHDRRYAIDPTKIETELGWRAAESFESGLRKTIDWYLGNRTWWQPLRRKVYAGERLGLLEA